MWLYLFLSGNMLLVSSVWGVGGMLGVPLAGCGFLLAMGVNIWSNRLFFHFGLTYNFIYTFFWVQKKKKFYTSVKMKCHQQDKSPCTFFESGLIKYLKSLCLQVAGWQCFCHAFGQGIPGHGQVQAFFYVCPETKCWEALTEHHNSCCEVSFQTSRNTHISKQSA